MLSEHAKLFFVRYRVVRAARRASNRGSRRSRTRLKWRDVGSFGYIGYWPIVGISFATYAGSCYLFFFHTQVFGGAYYQRLLTNVSAQKVHERLQKEFELTGIVAALMTSAAFSSFREPPAAVMAFPRLPQLCGCFMGLGMSLNFVALVTALHLHLKLNEYDDGTTYAQYHLDVLPFPRRLLFAGGMALCYGKAVLSFAVYELPAAVLTVSSLCAGGFGLASIIKHMRQRELTGIPLPHAEVPAKDK